MKNKLDIIRTHSASHEVPIISKPTQSYIESILNQYKPKKCLEVGGCIWYSWIFMSNIINSRWWRLISFEISYPSYKQALKNISSMSVNNFTIYNLDFALTPLNKLIKRWELDFVFIDAMKKDYLRYYLKLRQFMAKNCIVIFDDVIKYSIKMKNLYRFLEKNQMNYKLLKLDEDDGIIIVNNFKF